MGSISFGPLPVVRRAQRVRLERIRCIVARAQSSGRLESRAGAQFGQGARDAGAPRAGAHIRKCVRLARPAQIGEPRHESVWRATDAHTHPSVPAVVHFSKAAPPTLFMVAHPQPVSWRNAPAATRATHRPHSPVRRFVALAAAAGPVLAAHQDQCAPVWLGRASRGACWCHKHTHAHNTNRSHLTAWRARATRPPPLD